MAENRNEQQQQQQYEYESLTPQGRAHYDELRRTMSHPEAYLKALEGDAKRWWL